ncbi:uncharacterized protein LOC135291659 [Passer domesticus]|uniref:uncharacterized protein LOC135291659 n=1 Tax=Passer domesticus TaxID=48849 RepID=UPI0030FE6DCA
MEPQELSPAMLHPPVTVVATLGELLATLPRLDEMKMLVSPLRLYSDLKKFCKDLRATLYRINGTWWHRNVTCDGDDPPTSLSRALAAYERTPWTTWFHVTVEAWHWHELVDALVDSWAQLAGAATKLRNTCREVATEAGYRMATAWARRLQDKAAHDGTAQENTVELGQALGREEGAEVVARHEARVRRDARVATNKATRATTVRQRAEEALGLLERLVAACHEATAFPQALQRLLRNTEAALEGTNEASPNVPEDLMAKVAKAERLWEANARLAKDHLLGAVDDIIKFYFTGGPASPSGCGVAERCQRAIEDIPRLLRAQEHPQSIPEVSPVSMEPQELSPALLQPQVTVVAILGELLATLPRKNEMMMLSAVHLYWDLVDFNEYLTTLYWVDDIWWRYKVTSDDDELVTSDDDDDHLISLSQALASWESTPWTTWDHVTMAAIQWSVSVDMLVDSWAPLARRAAKLRNTGREMATEAAAMLDHATIWERELQEEAARDGTAQENMVELGQAQGGEEGAEVVAGHEAQVRRDARVAASEVTRATMVRQRVEVALGLLERLVAACDEATVLPRELQRRVGDIKAALEGTNEASPNVSEALVAKVAVAERLWEANARLAKDHLEGTLDDTINLYFSCGPNTACGVAERCQRATEGISRLLRPLECPQGVSKDSPVNMELQELSPALLQPQVTVVAILGELLATLPSLDEMMLLFLRCLYWDLEEFIRDLRATLYCTDDIWWHRNVTSDDDDPPTPLRRALATCESTPWTPQNHVTLVASEWQGSVAVLVNSWAELVRAATELHNACREVVTEAADREATSTARARELQDKAARDGTAQENMMELGQGPGGEEGATVVARHEAWVREEARMAASWAASDTKMRQRVEEALGLLERLVAACDEANAFPRELQRRVGEIVAAMNGTNGVSPNVPEDLVAKVAVTEWLWDANVRLAKDHLGGTLEDIIDCYFSCGPDSPRCHMVAERCRRATEDIPRLLQAPAHPQSVPKLSSVSMELQELSPALLQPQVTVVAILGELLATLPRVDEMMRLLMSPTCLYWDLEEFTKEFRDTLYRIDDTWWYRDVIFDDDDPPTSIIQALAAWKNIPWTTQVHVILAACHWHRSVSGLVNGWAQRARAATKLRNTCRRVVNEVAHREATSQTKELQEEAARDGTAQENMAELGEAPGAEEGAEVVDVHKAEVREEAREAASEATRATTVRQRLEEALGLLERLVAACDEATAFPRELQRLLRDIKAALEGINVASPNVPEDLVPKVAVAERLLEANAHLAKNHLLGTVDRIIEFYFTGGPASPSACGVAKRCRRATEDIPRLLRPPECPKSIPEMSPVSMEPREVSPPHLHALVAVVATLGEVVATVTGPHRGKFLHESPDTLHEDLKNFTRSLCKILDHSDVTSLGNSGIPSLGRALAALRTASGTTQANVRAVASAWRELVARLVDCWDQLAREATKLRDTCRKVVTDQQLMVARDKEEVAQEMATHDAQVVAATNEAMGEAVVATRRGHWAEVALGPLQRLVAMCDKATLFNWNMECRLKDIKAILKGTNEVSPDVLQALVAKVAEFEWLWVASARLAKDHLLGTLGVIDNILLSPYGDHGGPGGPGSHTVDERCQKAIEDIPRLLLWWCL